MSESEPKSRPFPTGLVTMLVTLSVMLLAGCIFLGFQLRAARDAPSAGARALLNDPEIRREAMNILVARSAGVWDSHNDPDVGRIMQPNLTDREFRGVPVASNHYGMREERYAIPKQSWITRVVRREHSSGVKGLPAGLWVSTLTGPRAPVAAQAARMRSQGSTSAPRSGTALAALTCSMGARSRCFTI